MNIYQHNNIISLDLQNLYTIHTKITRISRMTPQLSKSNSRKKLLGWFAKINSHETHFSDFFGHFSLLEHKLRLFSENELILLIREIKFHKNAKIRDWPDSLNFLDAKSFDIT